MLRRIVGLAPAPSTRAFSRLPSDESVAWLMRMWSTKKLDDDASAAGVKTFPLTTHGNINKSLRSMINANNGVFPPELCFSLWRAYFQGTAEERREFLLSLSEFGVDVTSAKAQCEAFLSLLNEGTDAAEHETRVIRQAAKVKSALTPLYGDWFVESMAVPNGLKHLIDLRADIHALLPENTALEGIMAALTAQLKEWFSVSLLALDEIAWSSTPPSVIELAVRYELVHEMRTIEDMRCRVAPTPNRHCFAFFHPRIPSEPIVMIQVALMHGVTRTMADILPSHGEATYTTPSAQRARDATAPNTAIFYSINSTQKGLHGIELGNHLIKRVAMDLQRRFPAITTFSTLSPIPTFVRWLTLQVKKRETLPVCESTRQLLREALGADTDADALEKLVKLVTVVDEQSPWWRDEKLTEALRRPLMKVAAYFLSTVKKRGRVYDPVGNFHVKNGAQMYQLNWLANTTRKGSGNSACIMVNYLYDLGRVEERAAKYERKSEVSIAEEFTHTRAF